MVVALLIFNPNEKAGHQFYGVGCSPGLLCIPAILSQKKNQALATSRGVLVVPVALFVHHGYRLHVPNQKQRPGISSDVLLPAGVVHPRDYVPKRGRILSVRAGCRTTLRKMPFRPPNISQSTCDFRHGKSNTCPQNSHFSH